MKRTAPTHNLHNSSDRADITRHVARRRCGWGLVATTFLLGAWLLPGTCLGVDFMGFKPGIRAGGTIARLSLSSTPAGIDNQNHPGFLVGATLGYDELPVVGLELQVLYVEEGGELEGSIEFFGDTLEGQAKIKVSYLTIPLLANFKMPGTVVRPYAKLGPQVGFRISSNAELIPREGTSVETDIKDDTNVTDFSWYFAGGVEFPLTTMALSVEVGYSLGFTDLFERDQNIGEPLNAKNHVLFITAGLSY